MKFAARYADDDALSHAVRQWPTWHAMTPKATGDAKEQADG